MNPAYFHGGVRGLRIGQHILPPETTGAPTTADYGADQVCRRDRVYLVTKPSLAGFYALLAPPRGKGWIYQVLPDDPVEPDTDWLGEPGVSVCASRARVVRILHRDVELWDGLTAGEALARLGKAA